MNNSFKHKQQQSLNKKLTVENCLSSRIFLEVLRIKTSHVVIPVFVTIASAALLIFMISLDLTFE